MENNLQRWFAAAAEAEPIVKVEEVGAMINTTPRSVRVKPTFKQFTIMGASFIVITSLVYWMQRPAEEVITSRVQKPAIQRHDITETTKQQPLIRCEQTWANPVDKVSVTKYKTGATAEVADASGRQVLVEQPILSGVLEFQHRMVYLTEKDFEKLDMHFTKNGYNHYYKTYADHQKIKATQLRSVNDSFYFAPGYPGKNYVIKPWERDYYPLFLTDSLGNCQQNFHFQDCPAHLTYQQFTDSLRNDFLRLYTLLVPIAIRASAQGKLHVLWYKPTKELMQRIPNQHSFTRNHNQFVNREHQIARGEYVYLSNEELADLGIKTDGNVLYYKNINDSIKQSRYDEHTEVGYSTFSMKVGEHGSRRTMTGGLDTDGSVAKNGKLFWPAIVEVIDASKQDSDITIVEAFMGSGYEKDFLAETKGLLIPVCLSTVAKPSKYSYDLTYIFWFKPEEAFFKALPPMIAADLKQVYQPSDLAAYSKILLKYSTIRREFVFRKDFDSARVSRLVTNAKVLNEAGLKQLNIKMAANGFTYNNRFIQHGKVNNVEIIQKGHYTSTLLNDKLITPIKIRKKDKPFTAVAITRFNMQNIQYLYVYPDSVSMQKRDELSQSNFREEVENLIPIKINESSIIWFPKSKELEQIIEKEALNEAHKAEVKETAIASIHYLELSDSALRKLGISKEGTFVKVPSISNEKHLSYSRYSKSYSEHIFTMGSDSATASPPEKGDIMITVNDAFAKPMRVNPSYPKERYPEPVLITDGTGLHWRLYQSNDKPLTLAEKDSLLKNHINPWTNKKYVEQKRERDKKWLLAKLNTMIAIRVKSDEAYDEKEDAQKALHPDLIIWYSPDSLFLSRLPQALALQIKDELNHAQSNNSLSACTYFESCANVRGAVTAHLLYPNPTEDKTDLSITLSDARKVRVVVTDISGKTVKIVAAGEAYTPGSHTIGFSVGNLSEGMYLLLIESDKGERIVQRMVKK